MLNEFDADSTNIYYRCVQDSNEAIMISNVTGQLVYVNPAWSRIYGYTREEAVGSSPHLLHSGVQGKEFYEEMWASIRNPEIGHWKGELINKAKDGTLVPVLLTITPFRTPTGEISGYMGIAVNLSSMKQMAAQVAHQDRLASVGILASGLAHEIGTPLGVIRGRAEFLAMKVTDLEFQRELGVITAQIDRITKLIRSLLRMSRSFSDVSTQEVAPAGVVQDMLNLVGDHFHNENAELVCEIPKEATIRADSNRLEQILLNFVMNALHAIQKARRDGRTEGHFLKISLTSAPKMDSLTVEDSGCGISAKNLKRLFQPFFTTKDVGQGTGLGLAIVSQLAQEMGAHIEVKSKEGVGSSFILHLPKG